MASWTIEYYSSGWVEKTDAALGEIVEELSGHEEATFFLPNTSGNRTWVETDQIIRIKFDGSQVFLGVVLGFEPTATRLKCICYNGVYELLKRRVISARYENTPANVVAETVRQAASLANPLGSCPTTAVSVNWDQTLCFDAIVEIAKQLNKDYWTQSGDTLYIGARGSNQSLDTSKVKVRSRGVDRSKKRDKVHARGVDGDGNQLLGVAGTGDDVAVIWPRNVDTLSALNALASRELAILNSDDSAAVLTAPITVAKHLLPGDSVTVNLSPYFLSGSYQIKKTTKRRTTVEIEVGRKKRSTEEVLEELLKNRNEAYSASKGVEVIENLNLKPALICGATIKESFNLTTTYLKQYCVLPGAIAVAAPTGNMNSYEGGYIALALIEKNGTGERDLARDMLDLFATIQNADGSWYQQYNPYKNASGVHERVETIGGGYSGDLRVDSGAAMLAWAMARYDQVTSGTRYQTVVRKAMQFLRDLQYAHTVAHSTGLIANLIYEGDIDTYALAADCTECLLAMTKAMDAYGDSLTTSPGGYSVKTIANDVYYSLATVLWVGGGNDYYHTSYPTDGQTMIPFTFKEKLSYTAALCAWAKYVFANSGYRTTSDYSSQCEKALDFILPLTSGQWGGQMYAPYYGAADETQEEFSGYTALAILGCNAVNATKYADDVSKMKAFLKWIALEDGRLFDLVDVDGRLWRAKVSTYDEAYGFLSLPCAQALLAGA
jgi:hypothetical protein